MYYDDEARRFNFVSGLLLGAVLGTGLGLLLTPPKRPDPQRQLRDSAKTMRREVASRLRDSRGALESSAESILASVRSSARKRR